jgi:hypothetical protein
MKRAEPTTIREALADLRARGFDPKLVWAANPEGDRLGPVPEGWDKDWPEVAEAPRITRRPR